MKITYQVKSYLRQKKGFRKIAHRIKIRSWSTWIYRKDVIQWITEPVYTRQLPPFHKIFALYCKFWLTFIRIKNIIGARPLLFILIRLQRIYTSQNSTRLKFPNLEMYLNLEDPRFLGVGNEIISGDIHRILSLFIQEGDSFIDVGANQGAFSLIASTIVGTSGLIISIEPQTQLAHNIKKSLEIKSNCNYQVHQMAVGDSNDVVDLIVPQSSSGAAGIYREYSGLDKHNELKVPRRRFDESIEWKNFPGSVFVKLDIEGSEYAFLNGAKEMLRVFSPLLLMEINPISLHASGTKVTDLVNKLINLGYRHFRHLNDFDRYYTIESLNTDKQQNVLISKSERTN